MNDNYTLVAQVAYTHPQLAQEVASAFINMQGSKLQIPALIDIKEASNGNIDIDISGPFNALMVAAATLESKGFELEIDEDKKIILLA